MKVNERVLMPDGTWKEFPKRQRIKDEREGKVKPLPEETKEPNTNPPGRTKRSMNSKAKKSNKKALEKQKKFENEQRISGN
jgi:hypothetical protein